MGRPANRAEFLETLEKSQLLAKRHFEKVRNYALDHDELDDPERLAAQLIAGRVLTGFHASQLLRGRYRGFYVGSYKLLNLLGQGGMGRVYLAEQVRLQRLVALKVLRKSMILKSNQTVSRFRREAKTVALLRHPNIIQAFDYDEIDGVPFIVMEYIEGLDLGRWRENAGKIPYAQAADIMAQAASGLQHAHETGLVHRDIKPANLLVDPQGVVKILDLGLVSDPAGRHNGLTNDGDQLGTIDYIAPEQALNSRTADIRADIYSLGAVFYTVVTGQLLFPDKNTTEKLLLHQTEEPTSIRELAPELPSELADVIEKMMQKNPDERYATPQDVVDALAPFGERKTPPYDVGLIKYRAEERSEFLDRSPRASSIVVRRSTAQQSPSNFTENATAAPEQSADIPDSADSADSPAASKVDSVQPVADSVKKAPAAVRSGKRISSLIRLSLITVASLVLVAIAAMSIPGFMSAAETGSLVTDAPDNSTDTWQTAAVPPTPPAAQPPGPGPIQYESRPPQVISESELPFLVYIENDNPATRPFDGESGIMGPSPNGIRQDFACTNNPYSGKHCLKISFDGSRWGGVTWQSPSNGWGAVQGGFDLSSATKFSFWARGESGGEQVEFKIGATDPSQSFPDSGTQTLGRVTLSDEWQKFEIPTTEIDMTEIKAGLIWVVESDSPVVFYLDDIVYE